MHKTSSFTAFSNQPKGLFLLTFGELCERFGYYGNQMLLVLYLTKIFFLSDNQSYTFYGAYAAFAYALPVLGGILADRVIGLRKAIILGLTFLIIGNLLLAFPSFNTFCLGLAFSLCGIGLYKANSASAVGVLYKNDDPQKEVGYTIFYTGFNIGATLGPIIYSILIYKAGWHAGFIFSAVILTSNLLLFIYKISKNLKLSKSTDQKKLNTLATHIFIYLSITAIIVVINLLLTHTAALNNFISIFFFLTVIYLLRAAIKLNKQDSKKVIAILILLFFCIFFFAASFQVGSSINLFINRNVNRVIFGWEIPTLIFTSLYPLAVIILAPFFSKLWLVLAGKGKNFSVPSRISIGLIFASLGFISFGLSTFSVTNNFALHYPLTFIIIGNLCLGAGELCIAPTIFTSISQFSPAALRSTMMGAFFLFAAFGGYISSILAKASNHSSSLINFQLINTSVYGDVFLKIALLTGLTAIILILATSKIKSLLIPKY